VRARNKLEEINREEIREQHGVDVEVNEQPCS